MKWKIRRLVYWLLGIPDEIEESIGGLNWGCEQNARRINALEQRFNAHLQENEWKHPMTLHEVMEAEEHSGR